MSRRRPGVLAGLLTAEAISLLGTRASFVALPWFVLVTTGSAVRTGVVAFAEMAPYVLVLAAGGPLIDRLGPRRTVVAAGSAAAVALGAIPLLHASDLLGFGSLVALVAVAGLLRAFADSATRLLLPGAVELTGTPMERATGLYDGVNRLATLLGGPLAGVLIAVADATLVLAVDAVSFLVAAAVLVATVPAAAEPPRPHIAGPRTGTAARSYFGELREGMRWLLGSRLMLGIAVMVFVTNLMDQAYTAVLLPVWAARVIGDPLALGLVVGAFGAGAVTGNALLIWLGPRLPRRATFAVCFLVAGSPRFAVLAFLPVLPAVLAVAFLGGLGAGGINPIIGAVEFERIPRRLQARVLGAVQALAWAGIPVGGLLAGWLVGAAGLTAALLTAGACYLLATLAPFVFPAWRGLERPDPDADRPLETAARAPG